MLEIIQISDLHYGSSEFRKKYLKNTINYINDANPDIVVCTGDLAHKGREYQYQKVKKYLDKINPEMISVPGNHDAKNYGLLLFEEYIGPIRTSKKINEHDAIILGLRSAKDGTSTGELGREQLEWILEEFSQKNPETGREYKNKILALHHHLIDVPYSGVKENILRDAGDALELVRMNNVDLVLMGHRHVPHVWIFEDIPLVYCGTSASKKYRAKSAPCFNQIHMDENKIEVDFINSKTLEEQQLLYRKNGKTKFVQYRKTMIKNS